MPECPECNMPLTRYPKADIAGAVERYRCANNHLVGINPQNKVTSIILPFKALDQCPKCGLPVKVDFDRSFSGSIAMVEDQYKKAIVSSMEVLDGIGVKTALFAFGGQLGDQQGIVDMGGGKTMLIGGSETRFFKVKRFEEPKWSQAHAARAAALSNAGSTPTDEAYRKLAGYIRRHRPDVTLTLTDGAPDNRPATGDMVAKLKPSTRMVAVGIGMDLQGATAVAESLGGFGYAKVLAVPSVQDLPKKLVRLIAPT